MKANYIGICIKASINSRVALTSANVNAAQYKLLAIDTSM